MKDTTAFFIPNFALHKDVKVSCLGINVIVNLIKLTVLNLKVDRIFIVNLRLILIGPFEAHSVI